MATTGSPGFLNVFFHGEICFSPREEKTIRVRVPLIKHNHAMDAMSANKMSANKMSAHPMPAHVYIAGNWLGERMFMPSPRPFQLKGVAEGTAPVMDKAHNFFLDGAKFAEPAPPGHLYAEMHLPKPESAASLLRTQIDPYKFFTGKDFKMVEDVREVSAVQVFTYRFEDHLKLQLDGLSPAAFSGDGYLTQSGGNNYCSLHIFAELDTPPGNQAHRQEAFKTALTMYRKANGDPIDLKIVDTPPLTPVLPITPDQLPPGTMMAEFDDLIQRAQRLSALGVLGHSGTDLNGIFDDDNAINGSDPVNCWDI
jgi:hypothetical protein